MDHADGLNAGAFASSLGCQVGRVRLGNGSTENSVKTLAAGAVQRKDVYSVSVRFSSGAYTYRVVSGSTSGAGVQVEDAKGKSLSTIVCAESPTIFPEYLRLSLPCDMQNPHGAAACKKEPYAGK